MIMRQRVTRTRTLTLTSVQWSRRRDYASSDYCAHTVRLVASRKIVLDFRYLKRALAAAKLSTRRPRRSYRSPQRAEVGISAMTDDPESRIQISRRRERPTLAPTRRLSSATTCRLDIHGLKNRFFVTSGFEREEKPALCRRSSNEQKNSLKSAIDGWRRSADRTRLRPNSQLTVKFTGKFAIFGLRRPTWALKTAALQALLEEFPTQLNRENIPRIREVLGGIREILGPSGPRRKRQGGRPRPYRCA